VNEVTLQPNRRRERGHHMIQQYDIVDAEEERGRYRVTTRSYIYSLRDSEGEIIGYHIHP